MRNLKSEGFKSKVLLGFRPGEEVSIQCLDRRDYESKAVACRAFGERYRAELLAKGIGSLTVRKAGDAVVLVTLNPIEKQEPFTDTLLEGDTAPEDEAYN